MRVVIIGAGQVGTTVADALAAEDNDITVIDTDHERLQKLQDRLDIRTMVGNAATPSALRKAGLEEADMLIAVTQSDTVNLTACKLAHARFNVPTRIARLRSRDFLEDESLLAEENFAVNVGICPEQIITEYIAKLIRLPGALQVMEFADGKLILVAVRAFEGGPLVNRAIKVMRDHLPPQMDARIAAIYRDGQPVTPTADTIIQANDEVFVIAARGHIIPVMRELRRMQRPVQRLMIAGGGNIGFRLAQMLEGNYEVKLIEHGAVRAEMIAGELSSALVLCGDATDENLMEQENIREMDMFLAVTNDDEDNIMAATLAKRLGCKRVAALINRHAYADMVQGGPIDIALSPAQISIGSLLTYVRRGDVARAYSLRRGAAEVLELVVHGDEKSSRIVGRCIEEIDLPFGVTIAALVRRPSPEAEPMVVIAHHDTVVQSEDHVVVFCVNKKLVAKVERLFQVGFHFL